jgi:hypothetical protein
MRDQSPQSTLPAARVHWRVLQRFPKAQQERENGLTISIGVIL